MRGWTLAPQKTALLVIDMHHEFLDEGAPLETPRGRAMIPVLAGFVDEARALGTRIIFTNHVHRRDGSDMGMMGEIWPAVRSGIVNVPDSRGAAIHEALQPAPSDLVIRKNRYSSFYGTDLDVVLRNSGIDTVIITGVLTNACCESTARDAMYRDYRVVFVSDLNATFDIPAIDGGVIPADVVQRVVCSTIAAFVGEVADAADVLERLRVGRAGG